MKNVTAILSRQTTLLLVGVLSLSALFLPLTTLRAATITNGMSATNVLGQTDFTTSTSGVTQSKLALPVKIDYDPDSSFLFTSDYQGKRILVFDLSGGVTDGMNASYVIGQPNFTSNATGTASTTFREVLFMDYDYTDNDYLFVSDEGNERVLVFDLSGGITNGMSASYVLGQPDFTTATDNGNSPGQNTLDPRGVVYDSKNDRLFVGGSDTRRVMVFDLSGGITNGMNASYVLGQPDFVTKEAATTTQNKFPGQARDLAYDEDNDYLFVSDAGGRVLVFDVAPGNIANGMDASYVLGQPDFTTSSPFIGTPGIEDDTSFQDAYMEFNEDSNYLTIGEFNNNRVLFFDTGAGITNGMSASYVLGQPDFATYTSTTTQSSLSGHTIYNYASSTLYGTDPFRNRIMIFSNVEIPVTEPTPTQPSSSFSYTHPPLCSATFSPNTITKGESTTLSWNTTWPTERENNYYTKVPGEGLYSQNVQSLTLQPQHTTEYTIAVFNLWGANFCNTTITVLDENGEELTSNQNSYLTAGVSNSPIVRAITTFFSKLFVR
jgi:hypothetical protein